MHQQIADVLFNVAVEPVFDESVYDLLAAFFGKYHFYLVGLTRSPLRARTYISVVLTFLCPPSAWASSSPRRSEERWCHRDARRSSRATRMGPGPPPRRLELLLVPARPGRQLH